MRFTTVAGCPHASFAPPNLRLSCSCRRSGLAPHLVLSGIGETALVPGNDSRRCQCSPSTCQRSSNTTFAAVNTTIRVLVIKIDPSSISMPYHTELVVVVDNLSSTLTARGLSNPDPKPGPEQSHVSSLPPSVAPRLSDEF